MTAPTATYSLFLIFRQSAHKEKMCSERESRGLFSIVSRRLKKARNFKVSVRFAVIAARLANMRRGDFHGNQYQQVVSANLHTPKISQEDAADLLNVSPRLVATVKAVEREARRFGGPGWPGGLERLSAPQVGGVNC
jgi:hypothetical protein